MKDIVNQVRMAGVVGAGGGGFPAYVKLQAKVDTVIANGSECEPILATDKAFMKTKAHLVVQGMKLAMKATGAKKGFIGIKGHYKDVVESVEKALSAAKDPAHDIKVALLDNYYPAGDEFMLVYDITGRVMPEGGIPLNVGVVVNNVVTLAQMADAANGKPVTHRYLTIAGEVKRPCVISAPIGTSYSELIKFAGGATAPNAVLLDGGPMMGRIVDDHEEGIGRTTSGILALPPDHMVIQMKQRTISQEMKRSRSACCQCFRCTDLCPRNNLGHDLYPHMTMRTMDYNQAEPTEHITSAFLCSQCGMCEMVACDIMGLSPKRVYAEYRKRLVKAGVKTPHTRKGFDVRSSYKNTQVSIATVLKKIAMTQYAGRLDYSGEYETKRVRVPLTKHAGAPAIPMVKRGQRLRMCDVIAESPKDKLGTVCHASISGTVTDITNTYVEITGN